MQSNSTLRNIIIIVVILLAGFVAYRSMSPANEPVAVEAAQEIINQNAPVVPAEPVVPAPEMPAPEAPAPEAPVAPAPEPAPAPAQ